MLGWACERASGTRMADLISALIWQPIGAERDAEITCDPLGSAIHDGGISATARDLARFGQMLVDDGMVQGQPGRPGGLAGGHPRPGARRPRGLRGHRQRVRPAGRLVPQSVLGSPGVRRPGAGLPRHPRPADLRRPRHADRGGQAVVLARSAAHRAICWTRCAPAPRWPRTWRRQGIEPVRSVRAHWAGRGLTVSRRLAWPPSRPTARTAPGRATDATRVCPSSWKVSGSAAPAGS